MGSTLTQLDHIAGSTIIQFTETDPALLNVDAIVEEQDTNLILCKSPVILEAIESFSALVKKMEQQPRERVGNVLVKQSIPKRFIAIVYDVEHTPIGMKIWIEEALQNILAHCDKYKIKTLAMPLTIAARLTNSKPTAIPGKNIDIQEYKSGAVRDLTSYRLPNFYINPSFITRVIFSLISLAFPFAESSSFSASFNSFIKSG